MKLTYENQNYAATVVSIDRLSVLEWLDNLVSYNNLGARALVSKDTEIGTVWLLFTTETQLSEEFCKNNNLFRDSTLNKDETQKGYLEKHRRVKAIKLRWNVSSALFMPLQSLSYLDINVDKLKVWDVFDSIDWHKLCTKFYIENKNIPRNKLKWKEKRFEYIDNKTFPEHIDTDNYRRNKHKYKDDDYIVVTQKLHGTSWRFWNSLSLQPQNWLQKLLGIKNKKYMNHYGSRRVIKTGSKNSNDWFYIKNVWNLINNRIKDTIPQDWIIYWEIVGWAGWTPIQKWYTYWISPWDAELYVYRISVVNQQGVQADLSWDALEEFCNNSWLKYTPVLRKWFHKDFVAEEWMDKNYCKLGYKCVVLDEGMCDEWVVIRKELLMPFYTKAKCQTFLLYETEQLDTGEIDIETSW